MDGNAGLPPVRLGVVGCGSIWHRAHAPALARLADRFTVVGVCSRTEESAALAAASLPGVPAFTTTADLLGVPGLEAVLIATPTVENAAVVTSVLRAGKHVLVEKPLACNDDEAAVLCAEAARHRVVAMVAENFRYMAGVQEARRLLTEGAIGPPSLAVCTSLGTIDVGRLAEWRQDHRHEGGFLLDGGVHFAAQLRELFGELSVVGATAGSRDPRLGRYDSLTCHATSAAGVQVVLTFVRTAAATSGGESRVAVFGPIGQLFLDRDTLTVNGQFATVGGDSRGFDTEYLDFWNAIRRGETVRSTFDQGRRDMQLILAALRVARGC
jgi:predicted dehydrogenase